MRALRMITIAGVALGAVAPVVSSQTCLGLPSFASGVVQLSGRLLTGNDRTSVGGGLAAGVGNGVFGGVVGGVLTYDDELKSSTGLDGNTSTIAGILGFERPLGFGTPGRRAKVCPVAGGLMGFGPENPATGEDAELLEGFAGFSVGARFGGSRPAFDLVPTVLGAAIYQKFDPQGDENAGGLEPDDTETGGLFEIGLGLVFNGRFGILPLVSIPIGFDNTDPTFGLRVAINFGPGR